MKKKALFLDRDGIVNEDVRYPYKPEQIVFCEGIFDICREALEKNYLIIIMTNQAGVAKGHFKEDDVLRLHEWMKSQFSDHGIEVTAFYYCPFHKEGIVQEYCKDDDCRKPKPGMFLKASEDFDIDFQRSLMVGDKPSDRIQLPDLKSVIVKSGYTGNDYDVESIGEIKKMTKGFDT